MYECAQCWQKVENKRKRNNRAVLGNLALATNAQIWDVKRFRFKNIWRPIGTMALCSPVNLLAQIRYHLGLFINLIFVCCWICVISELRYLPTVRRHLLEHEKRFFQWQFLKERYDKKLKPSIRMGQGYANYLSAKTGFNPQWRQADVRCIR